MRLTSYSGERGTNICVGLVIIYEIFLSLSHSQCGAFQQFASGIGKSAAKALGCAKGTWLSSQVQLWVGFVATGLSHVFGDYMAYSSYTGATFPFFVIQAAGITFEDFVIAVGKKLGIRDSSLVRLVGYAWTVALLLYTNVTFVAPPLEYGVGTHRMFSQSVVRPALQHLGSATGFDILGWAAEQCAV